MVGPHRRHRHGGRPLAPRRAGGAPSQVCVFAANSGSTGYGFWPGDGSDGMDGDYMASAGHRQNELGAAYTDVGVGVTCSGNQAWTVELFGYAYGDVPSASARQAARTHRQGTRSGRPGRGRNPDR